MSMNASVGGRTVVIPSFNNYSHIAINFDLLNERLGKLQKNPDDGSLRNKVQESALQVWWEIVNSSASNKEILKVYGEKINGIVEKYNSINEDGGFYRSFFSSETQARVVTVLQRLGQTIDTRTWKPGEKQTIDAVRSIN